MLRFRVAGIPVRVQPFFLLVAVVFGQMIAGDHPQWLERMALWVLIMFLGVLAHELGHAFTGRAFGMEPRIELHGLGGLTYWEGGRRLTPVRSLVVSLAGPAVGIFIGIPCLLAYFAYEAQREQLLGFALEAGWYVNLVWGIFNLLPLMPMDGGNALASLLEMFSPSHGRRVARYLSLLVSAALIATALLFNLWIAALLVGWLAWVNARALRAEGRLGEDLALVPDVRVLQELVEQGRLDRAIETGTELMARAKTPLVRGETLHLLAVAHLLRGEPEQAGEILQQLPPERPPDPAIRGAILADTGNPAQAIPLLAESLEKGPAPFAEKRLVAAIIATDRYDSAARIASSDEGGGLSLSALEQLEEAAYRAGHFAAAAGLGGILFDREGEPLRAFNVACSTARTGNVEAALEWLERARKAGFDRLELLDRDTDLDPVRALPGWGAFRSRFQ